MTTDTAPFVTVAGITVLALHPDTGPALLAAGVDAAGGPPELVRDPDGGAPLRCCLRDSRPGELLVLAAVTPPLATGPYRETGPVFVHADRCAGPAAGVLPPFWADRAQVLRAYDTAGRISGGASVPAGADLPAAAAALLADPAVAFLQARNVIYGCYMATVTSFTSL